MSSTSGTGFVVYGSACSATTLPVAAVTVKVISASQSPELEPSSEDMGQALGAHGVKEGFYVVWPILGPSTMRDTAGTVGDMCLNPISYLPLAASLGLSGQKNLNAASFRGEDYEDLTEAAIDPYDAVRDAYLQYRRAEIEK